jgi:hypothetical protein
MVFQAHLVMTIRERGITRATQVAWEVTERLREEGHETYVTSVNNIGLAPKRRRPKREAKPGKRKVEAVPS